MFANEIVRIPILPFGMVNPHLIKATQVAYLSTRAYPAPSARLPKCLPGKACLSATPT
jgi:hypothetical protein